MSFLPSTIDHMHNYINTIVLLSFAFSIKMSYYLPILHEHTQTRLYYMKYFKNEYYAVYYYILISYIMYILTSL